MKPFFNRLGCKQYQLDSLTEYIPSYETYIEPFFGGGSLFFSGFAAHRAIDHKGKAIINDIDKELIEGYKLIKKVSYSKEDIDKYKNENIQEFYSKTYSERKDRLLQLIIQFNNTYSSTGRGQVYNRSNPINKLLLIEQYKQKLKNTKIYSIDYKKIINKYDTEEAFFFLDPPYENSKNKYKHGFINLQELAEILTNIEGKFLLTLNDSESNRELFESFNIISVEVGRTRNNRRRELYIMNY
jgi:DNA adenine methylase